MAINYSLLLTLKSMFRDGKYGREHNKHDFDADYNNFVLMQDKLTILANYEQAHGGIDTLLSYLDDNVVGSAIKDACNDKRYLSKAIENAYLVEDLKAKLDGNKSFDDVARAVYEKFEGKITPAEFVGSSVYTGCFSGEHLSATLNDKIFERDYEAGHFLDTDELDEDAIPDEVYNLADTYYIGDYELESYSRESHIDLSDYAEKLNQFVIDKGFGKYVGNTVKSRLRSVLDYSFHEELCQAGSRVYFNRSLSGGNLEHLHDFVNYLIDNKSSFDKIAGDHVVDEVMRDKLVDVAKDVSELSYVQKCGVANIIYNSAWAGMNGEPIQTMKGLGYSRVVRSSYVYPYDISDELASNIVNCFCKNKEAAQVFKNINDGTQDPFGGPQENQVRKELNVSADDKDDDMEKSV